MRVLHVIPAVGPAHGGPTVAVKLMAAVCARAGGAVTVVATNANLREQLPVPLQTAVVDEGVTYIYFQRDAHFWTASRSLSEWLHRHVCDYDVVHIHALFSHATVAAARAARQLRVPFIVRPLGTLARYGMAQHPLLKRVSFNLFDRHILARAAAVHFTSIAERDEAGRLGGRWQSVVIPLGIDVSAYANVRDAHEGMSLLFLSRIDRKKRLDVILRALAQLPAELQARLVIAGDGDGGYVAELRSLAEALGVADRVQWAGHVSGAEKLRLLRAADVFVLPSMNENFGISVVEALASGLPVIVSPGVAIHREVAQASAGVVAQPEAGELAAGILALRDAPVREQMGRRGRELAETSFSVAGMGGALMQLYERLAS